MRYSILVTALVLMMADRYVLSQSQDGDDDNDDSDTTKTTPYTGSNALDNFTPIGVLAETASNNINTTAASTELVETTDFNTTKTAITDTVKEVTNSMEHKHYKDELESYLDVVYWEVKPFIFENEEGEVDGIIPRIIHQGDTYCNRNNNTNFMRFHKKFDDRHMFHSAVHSGNLNAPNVTRQRAFWTPVIAHSHKIENNFLKRNNVQMFQLFKSNEIAVIMPRYMISLPNKILRGILSCQQIFVIAVLLAILFGIFVWVIEHYRNDCFPKSFFQGMGKGLWWSLVSMTTVGYGDVVPSSPMGRTVALVWLFIGMMIGCVMTATMTDIVSGVADLTVRGKIVAVLENSNEEKVAQKDFRAKVLQAHSYEQALEFVRKGKAFAAMINADVAAWYLEEIQDDEDDMPLRIVQKLPAFLNINCIMSRNVSKEVRQIFGCMYKMRDEVYSHSVEDYRRYLHTETLYIGSVTELFYQNIYIRLLSVLVLGLIVIGNTLDIVRYFMKHLDVGDETFV